MKRLLLIWCLCCLCSGALAHAIVIASSPVANQRISGGAVTIEVRFNSRIDAARSTLRLFHRDGGAIILNDIEAREDSLQVKVENLTAGYFRLHWQTLSPDGHISQGDIPFEVGR